METLTVVGFNMKAVRNNVLNAPQVTRNCTSYAAQNIYDQHHNLDVMTWRLFLLACFFVNARVHRNL